jgi:hypothetical protein
MKSKAVIIWVLGVLMVTASLDAVPDPPAVNPHTVDVAFLPCEAPGGLCEGRSNYAWSSSSSHFQVRWIAFTSASEPNPPMGWIVLIGQAADPSPPLLEARLRLYPQS